jgi:hypothetical protein
MMGCHGILSVNGLSAAPIGPALHTSVTSLSVKKALMGSFESARSIAGQGTVAERDQKNPSNQPFRTPDAPFTQLIKKRNLDESTIA